VPTEARPLKIEVRQEDVRPLDEIPAWPRTVLIHND
jgi:hypothetical protein